MKTENQQFEILDLLTIFSLVIQLADHTKSYNQDNVLYDIKKELQKINDKLDYIIEQGGINYGNLSD